MTWLTEGSTRVYYCFGLNAYTNKYKVMSRDQNVGQSRSIKMENSSFARVEEFTYLGINLTN